LLDLSDQPWVAKLPAGMKSVTQYNGKTYNAVFGLNGIGAVYNQQALEKAGLQPPTTWTELLTFCRTAAGKGTPAFALGIQDNWVVALLKGKNPSGTFTLKALPATDTPASFMMPAAAGAGYVVIAKAKNKNLALKFISYVMSPEGMKVFNTKQGSLPAIPDN